MKIDSIASSAYGSAYGTQALTANTNAGASSGTASSKTQSSTAGSGVTVSLSDCYYDVRDLNKDGVVTLEEEIIYALTHGEQLPGQAAAAANAQGTAGYNQQGNMNEDLNNKQANIDIIV